MTKLFFTLLQITIILVFTIFIVDNSFIVSFEINDFLYSISSSYLFLILIILFVLIFFFQNFYFKSIFKFSKHKLNKIIKRKEKGYNSFIGGMIALANKDYKTAAVEVKKVSNYLNDNPSLLLLLKSEIFKAEKKYENLSLIYEEMSKNEQTKNLAYKGMMEQYIHNQDYHHAFIFGEKLFNNNPFIDKLYDALVNIIAKTNNWHQLLIITEKAYSKKIIDKKTYQENKSIGFFEISKIKQFADINESKNYIKKALNLRNNFPPYVQLYLQLLIQNKDYNSAKRFLKKTWGNNPHTNYISIIIILAEQLKMDMIELVKYIVSSNSKTEESKILIVEAYILSKKWNLAREKIKELLGVQPKKEICLLMVKIEEGETNDTQKINAWLFRAKNGEEKNIWICLFSLKAQNEWSSVSNAGYFNSLEWKKPSMLNQFSETDISLPYENK